MMRYGIIGEKLGHSFSPRIHAMIGAYPYDLVELAPGDVPAFMQGNDLAGFNVTIPYKQAVMPFLAGLSRVAQAIGSVNTVIRRADGSLWGDNTDAWGFARLLGDTAALRGKKALVLGSGGSSKTVQSVLQEAGIPFVVISREGADNYGNVGRHRDAALVVNTTPVGMYPKAGHSPLPLAGFPQCRLVIDLIYNPHRTALLQEAEALGMEARDGLLMLAAQAERAAQLWGLTPEGADRSGEIDDLLRRLTQNIALIGMPGCGKSAVGQALSGLTGRPLYDIDEMITREIGMPIPAYFERHGEEPFRAVETAMLARAATQSGVIIATGGGIVTRPENLPLLRQNSRVLWLRRDLGHLDVTLRPITQGRGVEALWRERAPLYEQWSERAYDNNSPAQAARAIQEDLL